MSDDFPSIGFNPTVELQAQKTGVDPEKIAEFMAIMTEEIGGAVQRTMERAKDLGLTFDQCLDLIMNVGETMGIPMDSSDLIEVIIED